MPGEEPIMFDDRKSVIRLRVKNRIPYLVTNDESENGPLGKLTESALGVLDYPEDHAVDPSGGLTSSPDETSIAVPAEEPGEAEDGDADERDEGGGSDEDEVEVDVEAGRGVKRTKGTLSWNTWLPIGLQTLIVMRVSEQRCGVSRPRRVRSNNNSKSGGDLVTFDFLTPERVGPLGIENNVFVVRDIYSGVRMAYPTSDGSTDEVVRCLKDFVGRRKIRVAYGDRAPQFVSACQQLGITFDRSLPGRPMNNSGGKKQSLRNRSGQHLFVGCWICSVSLVFRSEVFC